MLLLSLFTAMFSTKSLSKTSTSHSYEGNKAIESIEGLQLLDKNLYLTNYGQKKVQK
jgi:hypothetical protein